MRPISDLPARAHLLGEGDPVELRVWDVSVGGLAVVADDAVAQLQPGARAKLRLDVGRYGSFEVEVVVRHRGGDQSGTIGMELVDPPSEVTGSVGRYVAELLERGAPS